MLIDVSMPIKSGSVFRPGSPPVDISICKFRHEREGEYETVILSLPAHTATHVDLVRRDTRIPLERMFGIGKLIDVSGHTDRDISLPDVENQVDLHEGDFAFFRTGWSTFADTEKYYRHPELTEEVIHWLVSKKVNAVGIDALGLGRDRRHGEYDRLLVKHGIFIIENLVNLAAITTNTFRVYCLPLSIENSDAIPARVVVEIG
jgi:kynurenine formamidase